MYSDQALINMIKSGGTENDKAWHFIIKNWKPKLFSRIVKLGGTDEDYIELINEIYEPVVNRIRAEHLEPVDNLAAFLSQCLLYKWYKIVKLNNNILELDLNDSIIGIIDQNDEDNSLRDIQNVLSKILNPLNKNCAEVLYMWSEGYRMDEIAKKLNYKDANAMKKKKYKCLEQAKLIYQKLNL